MSLVCTLLLSTHTHIYNTQYSLFCLLLCPSGWQVETGFTSQSVRVYTPVCVCVCACMYALVWCRLMESCHPEKGDCQYALPSFLCSLLALRSAWHCCPCVRDVCRVRVSVLASVWNDFEKSQQSISSNITPLESTWRCCYWLKCAAAPVFRDIFWHRLISY